MYATRPDAGLKAPAKTPWVGPHFYLDLIRLTRKGWPTLARVGYLLAILASLAFMNYTQAHHYMRPGEYAILAEHFATTLIVIQDLLILAILPVYVASAIAEEKENQTLEALTLTHLSDRELVLGKFGGRIVHVAALATSSIPILAFLHLWGNVDLEKIIYHEVNTFLLISSAGSLCILISTSSQSTFQAVSRSYPWLAIFALLGIGGAFLLPWVIGSFRWFFNRTGGDATPSYLAGLPGLVAIHVAFAWFALKLAILQMERFRMDERKQTKKTSGAFALTDVPIGPPPKTGKRGETRSRIHPWAWPIRGDALWWKECIKDGTSWSLSVRWLWIAAAVIAVLAVPLGIIFRISGGSPHFALLAPISAFAFTYYFVALAAYAMVVVFQTTMSVAGEREHDTLTTLLMIPTDRSQFLLPKWIGPWWRNWPILALSLFGAVFGCIAGVYGVTGMVIMLLMPWPFFLMVGGVSLWLSVVCRRVLYANIAVIGILGSLMLLHIVAGKQARIVLSFYVAGIGDTRIDELVRDLTWTEATTFALAQQGIFLVLGALFLALAFRTFSRRDYAGG
jgi:ABC-type transport system involved in multi-copper enzyme maturation permease subunit